VLFRGFVFARMTRVMGVLPAAVVSSVLFTMFHFGYPPWSREIVASILTTQGGWGLLFVFAQSGTVLAPVLLHFARNISLDAVLVPCRRCAIRSMRCRMCSVASMRGRVVGTLDRSGLPRGTQQAPPGGQLRGWRSTLMQRHPLHKEAN